MKHSRSHIAIASFTVATVFTAGIVLSGERHQTGGNLAESSLTMEQAIAMAKNRVPGRVLEADREQEGGSAIIEVTIAAASGDMRKLVVDAQSGTILEERQAADHDGESDEEQDEDE